MQSSAYGFYLNQSQLKASVLGHCSATSWGAHLIYKKIFTASAPYLVRWIFWGPLFLKRKQRFWKIQEANEHSSSTSEERCRQKEAPSFKTEVQNLHKKTTKMSVCLPHAQACMGLTLCTFSISSHSQQPPSVCFRTQDVSDKDSHVSMKAASLGKMGIFWGRRVTLCSSWSPRHWVCVYQLLALFKCYLRGVLISPHNTEKQGFSLQEFCGPRKKKILNSQPFSETEVWESSSGEQFSHQGVLSFVCAF